MQTSNIFVEYFRRVDLFKDLKSGGSFPLLALSENVLISKNGDKAYCYELIPADLEQVSAYDCDIFYQKLTAYFNKVQDGSYFRYLAIDNRIFISSNIKEPNLPFCKLIPLNEPLRPIVGYSDFFSDLFHGSDFLKFNNGYLKIINFRSINEDGIIPEELSVFGDYLIQFEKKNGWFIRQKLEIQRNILLHNLIGLKRNIKSEKAYEDVERVMSDIIEGREMIYKFAPSILVRGKDYQEVSRKTELILKQLEQMGHVPYLETTGLKYFFQNSLFGVKPSFRYRSFDVVTSYLSNFLPVSRDYLMERGFKLESISGRPLFYDNFKIGDNANVWICGPSGKGKSYLAQHIQDYHIENEVKTLILEYGKSHEKLCKWHKAAPLDKKVNFLQFREAHYLKDLVISILGKDHKMDKEDQGRLFELISQGIEDNLFETNLEFINYLDKHFKGIRYNFSVIREFLTDKFHKIDSQVIYCDIKNYPEEMKEPILIFLFKWFDSWNCKKQFILEEVTKFVKKEFQAESISDCVRNKRKEGGSIITITQSINDINRYPFLAAIFESSDHRFFFEHDHEIKVELKPMVKEFLDELGGGSNLDQVNVVAKEWSEFVITCGKIVKIVRLRRDNLKYEIYTSRPEDIEAFSEYITDKGHHFKEFREKMVNYVRVKYGV